MLYTRIYRIKLNRYKEVISEYSKPSERLDKLIRMAYCHKALSERDRGKICGERFCVAGYLRLLAGQRVFFFCFFFYIPSLSSAGNFCCHSSIVINSVLLSKLSSREQ